MILVILGVVIVTLATLLFLLSHFYPPIWRDVYTLFVTHRILKKTIRSCRNHQLVVDAFEEQARRVPDRPFILFKDEVQTYSHVDKQSSLVARALLHLGVQPGDTVALVMSNEPAFIWIYLGVQKIGARLSLVNHHLVSDALLYSLTSCVPKLVIVGQGVDTYLPSSVSAVQPYLDPEILVYSFNTPKQDVNMSNFSSLMAEVASTHIGVSMRSTIKLTDPCAFIYTSGTTGPPKPAIITHKRSILCSHSYSSLGFSSKDVLYVPMPLYHASALNLGVLNVISVGATIALRDRFSVSAFWSDCIKYRVTCFQYIGEMLRYLVNAPPCPEETKHILNAAIGNGLRLDVWPAFKSRFKIANIYEFYGSTELPASTINMFNVPGSVGRLSPLLSKVMKLIIVRVDKETNQPYRNDSGQCMRITPGESGVLLAQLTNRATFDGYLGPASHTSGRIVQDVLEKGDFYVNTNDVFYTDEDYNLYFKDRIGDAFRWKGENVSSAEVSRVMNGANFVQDTNVFGIEIPGCEGKAGMAAINLKDQEVLNVEKLDELGQLCRNKLPGFARPRFLRFQRQMSLTSTFKQQKTDLIQEGFDPHVVNEPLYYLDRSTDEYRPLDKKKYEEIVKGDIAM